MTTAVDVPAEALIEDVSEVLKTEFEEIEPPEWAQFAKTSTAKELPPEDKDWWYTRTASILRRVYMNGPIGVAKLKSKYGARDRKGMNPSNQKEGSGSVIRKSLQQLGDAGLVDSTNRGRRITDEGMSFLDERAEEVAGDIPELEKY